MINIFSLSLGGRPELSIAGDGLCCSLNGCGLTAQPVTAIIKDIEINEVLVMIVILWFELEVLNGDRFRHFLIVFEAKVKPVLYIWHVQAPRWIYLTYRHTMTYHQNLIVRYLLGVWTQ